MISAPVGEKRVLQYLMTQHCIINVPYTAFCNTVELEIEKACTHVFLTTVVNTGEYYE